MARNKYAGYCYCCNEYVPVGFGHFERHQGGWRIKCVKCASDRVVHETDKEVQRVKGFYLLIAGSRTFNDYNVLKDVCDYLLLNHLNDEIHIIEGEAKGADTLAKRYAKENGYQIHPFPADWNTYGKKAGYKRNRQMHEFLRQFDNRGCVCFWDGQSKGTQHNFKLCEEFHTPLRIWNYTQNCYARP